MEKLKSLVHEYSKIHTEKGKAKLNTNIKFSRKDKLDV